MQPGADCAAVLRDDVTGAAGSEWTGAGRREFGASFQCSRSRLTMAMVCTSWLRKASGGRRLRGELRFGDVDPDGGSLAFTAARPAKALAQASRPRTVPRSGRPMKQSRCRCPFPAWRCRRQSSAWPGPLAGLRRARAVFGQIAVVREELVRHRSRGRTDGAAGQRNISTALREFAKIRLSLPRSVLNRWSATASLSPAVTSLASSSPWAESERDVLRSGFVA